MKKINILGVNISRLQKSQVLKKIEQFLVDDLPRLSEASKQHQIVTVNPEFLLAAEHDEEFFYILNKADLAVPDGVGLKFTGWLMGKNIQRITGADLVRNILNIAQDKNLKVAIINWRDGLSKKEEIEKALKDKYKDLESLIINIDRETGNWKLGAGNIVNFQPDILFVTLGAPWQEKFIFHNLTKLPSVKIAMGVGGSFDFITGKIKRAPKLVRIIGLEWLWRLFKQPWRWRRIYNAVIVFPCLFFKWRFIYPFLYRPNVVCLLYKKENNKYKILMVERSEEKGHWQLPQGGIDNQSIQSAGMRELKEELNNKKFKPVKVFKNLYKYKFGKREGESAIRADQARKYTVNKGQKQNLFIAEFLGKNSDIKINYWDHSAWKWVNREDLVDEVHDLRKEAVNIFLKKFNKIIML